MFCLWSVTEDPQSLDTDDKDGRDIGHGLDGEAVHLGDTWWCLLVPNATEGCCKIKPAHEDELEEKAEKISHNLKFCIGWSHTASISQSCDETLKSREAEENSWQSDEGVGQKLDSHRMIQATGGGDTTGE